MEEFGLLIMLVGLVVASAGQLWFLLRAFMESVLWGLAILFIPFAGLAFLVKRADVALKPTVVSFGGLAIVAWGLAVASEGGETVLLGTLGLGAVALVLAAVRMLAAPEKQVGRGRAAAPVQRNVAREDDALQKAIKLAEAGDKAGARHALIKILKAQPKNDEAWVWMAQVVESERLRQESLQEALKHNPQNWQARQALKLMSGELAWEPVAKVGEASLGDLSVRRGGGASRPVMGR